MLDAGEGHRVLDVGVCRAWGRPRAGRPVPGPRRAVRRREPPRSPGPSRTRPGRRWARPAARARWPGPNRSAAAASTTRRASRPSPTLAKASRNRADSAAMRKSQANASRRPGAGGHTVDGGDRPVWASRPGRRRSGCSARSTVDSGEGSPASSSATCSRRSWPTQNPRPAPVSTTARTLSSAASSGSAVDQRVLQRQRQRVHAAPGGSSSGSPPPRRARSDSSSLMPATILHPLSPAPNRGRWTGPEPSTFADRRAMRDNGRRGRSRTSASGSTSPVVVREIRASVGIRSTDDAGSLGPPMRRQLWRR